MGDYREEFQKLLETTYIPSVGNRAKIEKELNAFLNNTFLHTPEKLYRYRKCDQYSIDSFKKGTIYVCNADCFSDKYDSRVYVDRDKIVNELKTGFKGAVSDLINHVKSKNPDVKPESASKICYLMECGLNDQDIIDKMINEDYADFIKEIEKDMKKREFRFRGNEKTAQIGCFTESVQSKFMWDHYADGYKGFALEYNLKELIYKRLSDPNSFIYVFPVIYTDKMPDVTDDEGNAYMKEKSLKEDWMRSWAPLYHSVPLNAMHIFKPYLYKDKAEYSHEREWRLIYYDIDNREDYSLIPDLNCLKAIYYGPDITSDDKIKLHEIAKARGIAEYDVAFDSDSRNYNLKILVH
jgi:hypothetical protein